jgi:TatD DNase family protein
LRGYFFIKSKNASSKSKTQYSYLGFTPTFGYLGQYRLMLLPIEIKLLRIGYFFLNINVVPFLLLNYFCGMKYFNLHTHQYTNQPDVLELVNQYPQQLDSLIPYYSIGIHPLYIDENRLETDCKVLDEKLALPECLALGECGLDKRSATPLTEQLLVFERQLILAEKHQKPVVIHCVSAFQELMEIKRRLPISVPMIVHGYSKKVQLANQLLDHGFYISFGKYLLQSQCFETELKTVFQSIPNDRFFLETDTIEEGIQAVYALAADYKKIELSELQKIINRNWKRIFDQNQ